MTGSVIHIETDEHYRQEIQKHMGKVIVVDYFATWCGPCVRIAPTFSQLAAKHKDSVFLKVDVDKCKDTAELQGISAMPTFHVYKSSTKLDELRGADPVALERMVEKHCTGASADQGGAPGGYIDLNQFIDMSKSECLNESDDHTFKGALKEEEGRLESDCDEQLLLTLAFNQPVRIHSIALRGPDDGRSPKSVKLFINQTAIDFDSAERGVAVQELTLTKDDNAEGALIPLKYVKFQNVVSLTLYVRDNHAGDEVTVINYVGIVGQPRDKTEMKDFKRVSGQKGEVHG
ncbi:hypothetical protein ACHWQZ_G000771 [Mnemiopsis leidyi]